MREIKFRIWDKENKVYYPSIWNVCFIFGGIRFAWDDYENSDGETMITDLPKDSFELMQYTGLKDKNGIEIYEGDIIVKQNVISGKRCKEVEWQYKETGFFPFADSPDNCGHCGGGENPESYEVIGNIYQNPELLTNE